MRPFEYLEPETLDEALALVAERDDDTVVMAGGTALVILMKQDLIRPARVIGLRRLAPLRAVAAAGTLQLGALATHDSLARSAAVRAHCGALAATFAAVATPRIRAQATLGGNIAHADPAQDPPVTLLALDAEAVVMSAKRARRVPLADLFVDVFETSLEPDELLLRIDVPPLPPAGRVVYRKFLPNAQDDYATVSVAVVVATDHSGACTHARIALGAAGPVPIRAREAERALVGRRLDDAAIREAATLAANATDPFDDLRGSAQYKRAMAAVWTERSLREVA